MITLEQLRELKKGTAIYVAAPGRGPKKLWSNVLCQETFVEVSETRGSPHIMCEKGGYSFLYVREGEALFLDIKDAAEYMREVHIARWTALLAEKGKELDRLREELATMYDNGPGEPDYKFHGRLSEGTE